LIDSLAHSLELAAQFLEEEVARSRVVKVREVRVHEVEKRAEGNITIRNDINTFSYKTYYDYQYLKRDNQ